MPLVGDHYIAFLVLQLFHIVRKFVLDQFHIGLVSCRNSQIRLHFIRHQRRLNLLCKRRVLVCCQIHLILQQNNLHILAPNFLHKINNFGHHTVRFIKQIQNDFGGGNFLARFLHPDFFDHVPRLPNTRCIDEPKCRAVNMQHFLNRVPRCARNIRYNGAFFLQQCIQQRGLARVGFAHNGYFYAIFNRVAIAETFGQALDFGFHRNLLRNPALQLVQRHLARSFIFRGNQVRNRFRLRQVDTAVHKSAHGEFSRFREAGAVVHQHFQNASGNMR